MDVNVPLYKQKKTRNSPIRPPLKSEPLQQDIEGHISDISHGDLKWPAGNTQGPP